MKLLRTVLGILVPPLGVFWTVGVNSAFWINIVLTLIAWFPGAIHAVWVMKKYDRTAY